MGVMSCQEVDYHGNATTSSGGGGTANMAVVLEGKQGRKEMDVGIHGSRGYHWHERWG